MPEFSFSIAIQYRLLANQLLLADPLLFPEISCLDDSPRKLIRMLKRRLADVVRSLPSEEIHARWPPAPPQSGRLTLRIPPLARDPLRRRSVLLRLPYSTWQHHTGTWIASFPTLGIDVLADDEQTLQQQLEPQVRSALARQKANASLLALVRLADERRMRIRPLRLRISLPTLKEASVQKRRQQNANRSVLDAVALNLTRAVHRPVYERDALVGELARRLTGPGLQSVLLVGPSGVGKSALVRELARQRSAHGLETTPFWSTRGSSLVAGMCGFGMWQQRCQDLVAEARRTRPIVHLDNLIELREVGKGGGDTTGVASMLRPSLIRGDLRGIAECTPEQLALIERDEPQLLEAFNLLTVDPPTAQANREILRRSAVDFQAAHPGAPGLSDAALDELDRVHRQYATYSAAPGRHLRFLSNLLEDSAGNRELTPSDVIAAFAQETGLPRFMLDDEVSLCLDQTRDWFTARVLGQAEPIELLVGLLAAIKTGLTRRGKPIAGLLFIGPTGVGKTETARALAEFLYRDPERMIRIDMSEYSDAGAVDRLIGGSYATPGLLTQKVRDQPFMVVLLDEFEKAHPRLFDLLLQVLGEGRLTDAGGRLADFTNTVIIMTSNLGADSFRAAGFGFQVGSDADRTAAASQHFQRAVQTFLRPEMVNRIDQIVPFAPLSRDSIREIGRREIARLASRIGLRSRRMTIAVTDDALDRLTAAGYDPRYGARPLKREIERRLTAVLAERLCRSAGGERLTCQVEIRSGELSVEVTGGAVRADSRGADRSVIQEELLRASEVRRQVQRLERSGAVLRLRNELELARLASEARERRAKRRKVTLRFQFGKEEARQARAARLLADVDSLARDIQGVEQTWLEAWYSDQPLDPREIESWQALCRDQLHSLLRELYRFENPLEGELTLFLFSADRQLLADLTSTYAEIARSCGGVVKAFLLQRHDPALRPVDRGKTAEPDASPMAAQPDCRLSAPQTEAIQEPVNFLLDCWQVTPASLGEIEHHVPGVALSMRHPDAISLLGAEAGRHVWIDRNGNRTDCIVEVCSGVMTRYHPPENVGREGSFANVPDRRTFDLPAGECHDVRLREPLELSADRLTDVVLQAAQLSLTESVLGLLD